MLLVSFVLFHMMAVYNIGYTELFGTELVVVLSCLQEINRILGVCCWIKSENRVMNESCGIA